MALTPGARVPSFTLPGSDGKTWSDEALRGRPYVLTFYPKDETPGCIMQVCAFRDAWSDFEGTGVLVFGVSRDDVASHQHFVEKRKLPYVLLADEDARLHKALDIGKGMFGGANRVSYLVDGDGVIVEAYESNMSPTAHAEKMLEAARRVGGKS